MDENATVAAPRKAPSVRFGGTKLNIGIAIAALVTIAGIVLWGMQMSQGLILSNMRNLTSWGFYITCFMFFVGLSAGGLIISSAPRVFGLKGFGGISKIAVWVSICCTILAIAFVVIDLGHPGRLWELFVYSNMTSPLMWDIIVLLLYLVVSVVYLWASLRNEKGTGSQSSLRVLSVIALLTAIMVHTVTAWIFGLQAGRELWYTAILGPWFVSSALVCGIALVLSIVIALRKAGYFELAQENVVKMVKLLGVFVAIDLYFLVCDLLTAGFPGGSGAEVVKMLSSGPLAVFFWIEIICCILVMAAAFIPSLRKNGIIVTVSILAIIAIFCKRVQLLVGGFQITNINHAGVISGPGLTDSGLVTAGLAPSLVYFPSPLEIGLVLGVVGLGVLMLFLGIKHLPLRPHDGSN